jgi:hypothetical protein
MLAYTNSHHANFPNKAFAACNEKKNIVHSKFATNIEMDHNTKI